MSRSKPRWRRSPRTSRPSTSRRRGHACRRRGDATAAPRRDPRGGMAGLAAAWRLSEPGWQDEFESITVYQRGWRLGGKGASSRGPNGRIEEHGLHLWLGYYENSFRLLRECYAELDRPDDRPGGSDPDLAGGHAARGHRRPRGSPARRLAPLARGVHAERPRAGRARDPRWRSSASSTCCVAPCS